ncbi:MAG: hypothetical protein JWO36_3820 [Myxococcales bacterium]|nr:hypothetical protein [Myxococcales bacterium]
MRRSVLALCLVVACKSPEDKAAQIIADESKPETERVVEATQVLWKDTKAAKHTVGAECRDGTCRVFVVIDRADKGTVETHGTDVTIKFFVDLSDDELDRVATTFRVGTPLKLEEVLVADRYKTEVEGTKTVVVSPRRTVDGGDGTAQSFNEWKLDDMGRLEPYDLVMGKTKTVVVHPQR